MPIADLIGWGEPFSRGELLGALTPLLRILAAMVLGATIGWERERHGRPAGLRTHLLLCVGCALTVLTSQFLVLKVSTAAEASGWMMTRADPTRMAAHVMSGIGFLGAGAIIVIGTNVRGLTTAACLWVTASIGVALGAGYWLPPLITYGVVMFALLGLGRLENWLPRRDRYVTLTLSFSSAGEYVDDLKALLAEHTMTVLKYRLTRNDEGAEYKLSIRYARETSLEQISEELMARFREQGLTELQWE